MPSATQPFNAKLVKRRKNEDGSPLYPQYMPFFDPAEERHNVGPFDHDDPGHRADPSLRHLLSTATSIKDISPHIGTEIHGVQLSQLCAAGLDELALLTARRGALVFRDQDFVDIGFDAQVKFAEYFGPLHVHTWAPRPIGGSAKHTIIYDSKEDLRTRKGWAGRSPIAWHCDQSPLPQPPGTTFMAMIESPAEAGGDTLISSMTRAYQALSPRFRKRLDDLVAVHALAETAKQLRGGDKDIPIESKHPVVIVHPVTGEKALFVNPMFTKRIVGFDKEESDCILNFLFDHIAKRQDFSCRISWDAGTVLVWDQRVTCHSQTLDFPPGDRRHGFRLTPLANKPIPAKVDEEDGCENEPERLMFNTC